MTPFEAARVLARNSELKEAQAVLKSLWNQRDSETEFELFCSLTELSIAQDPHSSRDLLAELTSGSAEWNDFWNARTLVEQGILLEWYGELSYFLNDRQSALDALTRAASLGRDTSNLWIHLGILYLQGSELDLAIRYLRRSLELYKQPGLEILDPKEGHLGAFIGSHPLDFSPGPQEYLGALLEVVKLAKGRRALKSVRDLVVEMIHQFPNEERLPKIRLLLERSLVTQSTTHGYPSL